MTNRSSAIPANRALALDALRGLAILAMLLSGQLPFNQNALPSWMYHAQEPPPTFESIGTLPGISWVDLVFPLFLFAMGAAFPLALSRRMENKTPTWKLLAFVLERGFLLGFFVDLMDGFGGFFACFCYHVVDEHFSCFLCLQVADAFEALILL